MRLIFQAALLFRVESATVISVTILILIQTFDYYVLNNKWNTIKMNDLSFSQVNEVKCRVVKIWLQFYVNNILYKQSDFVFLNTFQMKTNRDILLKKTNFYQNS